MPAEVGGVNIMVTFEFNVHVEQGENVSDHVAVGRDGATKLHSFLIVTGCDL